MVVGPTVATSFVKSTVQVGAHAARKTKELANAINVKVM